MAKDINKDIPGDLDQIASSLKSTAQMIGEMFKLLKNEDMTNQEAFVMTQTWLTAMLANASGKKE